MRLAHDYAATVFSAQGLTSESCAVLVDPSFDRQDLYVAASRSRGRTRLVVDERGLDVIVRADRRLDGRGAPVGADERQAALLKRLSRERRKETTLESKHDRKTDVGDGPRPQALAMALRRERRRELDREL